MVIHSPHPSEDINSNNEMEIFLRQDSEPTMSDNSQQWNNEQWLFMQQQGGGQGQPGQTTSNGSYSPLSTTSDLSSSSHGSYQWVHGAAPFDASSVSAWVGPRKSLVLFYMARVNLVLPKVLLSLVIPPPPGYPMVQLSSTPLIASIARTTPAAIQWKLLANTA